MVKIHLESYAFLQQVLPVLLPGVTNGEGEVISSFMCFGLLVLSLLSSPSLGFALNNVSYPNGSTVLRIGEGDAALQCTTDRAGCCGTDEGRTGEFYFPDDTQVPISDNDLTRTYYRNRTSGGIRLNHQSVTGEFHCEIPDANGTMVDLFIHIGTK